MTIVGPPRHERRQRIQERGLGLDVEVGRGLVQDQDRRVLDDRPGDGQPLTLAARQQDAVLADAGLVALRERLDERVDLRQATGLLDPLVRHVGIGDREVVADRRVEQVDVLGDHAEQPADVLGSVSRGCRVRRSGSRPRGTPRSAAGG